MTFQKILDDLNFNSISIQDAYNEISSKENMKKINYFIHINNIKKDPLTDGELNQLIAIVDILQIIYNSKIQSPISDNDYDTLQEILIDMGVPRLSGSIEINDSKKVSHQYLNLRGTLNKIYYLSPDDERVNKSRKYLDEWIKSMELKYEKNSGEKINLNDIDVLLQSKFDGTSVILECNDKPIWITRGDTKNNRASDVSHIMNVFNDVYATTKDIGIKFELMITEEDKDTINSLYGETMYKNSRQVATSILNSIESDFKSDYLYPVPLRIIHKGDGIEQIHPDMIKKFPTKKCKLSDREVIKQFAHDNKYVDIHGKRLRTDGVVITIIDPKIQSILGRENNINNFEVAYKFTEEVAQSKVKNVIFELSEFGFICPVVLFHDVILKGNTIQKASLSNKERFDELDLHYGDLITIKYDIIPYVTKDPNHKSNGRKIEFIDKCPKCNSKLDLNVTQVQCKNKDCPSRVIGRILNYCNNLRIQNIGYQTIETLYNYGLLNKGIKSLYKLKKKTFDIEDLNGFGKLKTKKIIAEIESKRRLKDYEFFGSIGIETLSMKTFESIFSKIKFTDFINLMKNKNFSILLEKLLLIDGMGERKSQLLIDYLSDVKQRVDIIKILEELSIHETYGENNQKGTICVSGFRPSKDDINNINSLGWNITDKWSNKITYLVIPDASYESSKVNKARNKNIPIIIGMKKLYKVVV